MDYVFSPDNEKQACDSHPEIPAVMAYHYHYPLSVMIGRRQSSILVHLVLFSKY